MADERTRAVPSLDGERPCPHVAQRGVTLSASTLTFSDEFMMALLDRMAQLGLNQLLFEANIADAGMDAVGVSGGSDAGVAATGSDAGGSADATASADAPWPHWTRERVARVVSAARERGIDVVPEVNAPGHMTPFLRTRPDLALVPGDVAGGEPDLERLDFTRPDAIDFYMSIVDSYADLFDSPWWHMGADEFELGAVTYADYPQIERAAKAKFGPDATPRDLFFDFVNQINAQMKARGKRLRMWNDGVVKPNIVELDRDITIEYWLDRGLSPSELVERGYEIMNVSGDFYWSRSEPFVFDAEGIYNERRLDRFAGGETVTGPGVVGLRCSIWPDRAWYQTENELFTEIQEGLVLVAQTGWQNAPRWETWAELMADVEADAVVEECPVRSADLPPRAHIPALEPLAEGPWVVETTPDGYIRFRDQASGCYLSLRQGRKVLGVVMGEGSVVELAPAVDPAGIMAAREFAASRSLSDQHEEHDIPWNEVVREIERPLYEYNCQKWVVRESGEGYTVSAALSGLELTDGGTGTARADGQPYINDPRVGHPRVDQPHVGHPRVDRPRGHALAIEPA